MIEICNARDATTIEAARQLFREYQEGLGVDLSYQGFATELESLPGAYAPPGGRLLLASDGAQMVGCVALRALTNDTCEMKRLYVRPAKRAAGVGRRLVQRVIEEARTVGYRRMLLDTLATMGDAQRLYAQLGFRDAPPYSRATLPGTRFLGLDL